MNWKNEKPVTLPCALGVEREAQIDDEVCSLLYHFGPDRHIDGHEEIAAYVCGLISAEREACAKIAESSATKDDEDWHNNPGQAAWDSACDEIAKLIRNRGAALAGGKE